MKFRFLKCLFENLFDILSARYTLEKTFETEVDSLVQLENQRSLRSRKYRRKIFSLVTFCMGWDN